MLNHFTRLRGRDGVQSPTMSPEAPHSNDQNRDPS